MHNPTCNVMTTATSAASLYRSPTTASTSAVSLPTSPAARLHSGTAAPRPSARPLRPARPVLRPLREVTRPGRRRWDSWWPRTASGTPSWSRKLLWVGVVGRCGGWVWWVGVVVGRCGGWVWHCSYNIHVCLKSLKSSRGYSRSQASFPGLIPRPPHSFSHLQYETVCRSLIPSPRPGLRPPPVCPEGVSGG